MRHTPHYLMTDLDEVNRNVIAHLEDENPALADEMRRREAQGS